MRTVNGNWSAVVKEMRKVVANNTFIKARAVSEEFIFTLNETDTFHPFDGDAERLMSRALRGMPVRCDYRSCASLSVWQDYREQLSEAIWAWCEEMQYLIEEYYSNPWNFPPGYVKISPITFSDWDKVSDKVFARVHRAALSE